MHKYPGGKLAGDRGQRQPRECQCQRDVCIGTPGREGDRPDDRRQPQGGEEQRPAIVRHAEPVPRSEEEETRGRQSDEQGRPYPRRPGRLQPAQHREEVTGHRGPDREIGQGFLSLEDCRTDGKRRSTQAQGERQVQQPLRAPGTDRIDEMFGAQTQAQARDDQPEVAERPDEGTQRPPRLRHPRGTAEPGSQADLNEPARPGRDRITVEAEAPPPRDVGRDEAETGRDICAQEGKVAECRLRAVEIRQSGRDRDDEERRGGGERDCPRPDHRERRPQERQHGKGQPADPPWNAVNLLELPPSHREGRARASQADRAGRESLLAERDSRHERRAEVRRGGKRTDRQVLHPGSTEDPGPQQVEHEIAPQAEECRQGLEAAVDARRDREGYAQVVAVAGQPLVLPAAREHEGQRGQHRVEEQSVDGAERSRELFPIAHRLPGRLLDRHEEIPEEVVRPEVSEEEGRESHVEERGMALEPERTGEQGEAEDRRRQGVAAVQGRRGRGPRQRQREGQTGE